MLVLAVPKNPVPLAVIAVVEAYGKVEAAVVDVAVNFNAVFVLYETTLPRKSESPNTSKIFPVVVVALWPRRKMLPTDAG